EWGHANVRANCLAPGLIRTDFSKAVWDDSDGNGSVVQALAANPLKRMGEPDDVAGAAIWLASAAGSYITGQTIAIDGGKLIGRVAA
ncbi:MAG: family oxidoreductase, partial [Microbacteriaceae bacterium]|nr:family oxidoreductase [Microbacteriaceae bacterium]